MFDRNKGQKVDFNDPTFMFGQRPRMDDFINDAITRFWYTGLRPDQIMEAIQTACDFFNIPMPQFIWNVTQAPRKGTGVFSQQHDTLEDDILQFNFKELAGVGITNLDSFTLVLTHECMHRVLQNITLEGKGGGRWEEELTCDFFIGVRAALSGMDDTPVANGLYNTYASPSHPAGTLRYEFIKQGKQSAYFDLIRHRPVTLESMFKKCLELLARSRQKIYELQYPFLQFYA